MTKQDLEIKRKEIRQVSDFQSQAFEGLKVLFEPILTKLRTEETEIMEHLDLEED